MVSITYTVQHKCQFSHLYIPHKVVNLLQMSQFANLVYCNFVVSDLVDLCKARLVLIKVELYWQAVGCDHS